MSQNPFCAKSTFYAKWEQQSIATIIASNKEAYYGKRVTNYSPDGGKYRIFYIDTQGKFGEKNTLYLRRDCVRQNMSLGGALYGSNYSSADLDVINKMNPMWYEKRTYKWYLNSFECCPLHLCAPAGDGYSKQYWLNYYDGTKAKFAIGAPSIEMYVASYNDVPHTVGNVVLGCLFVGDKYPCGYKFTENGLPAGGQRQYKRKLTRLYE